MQELINQLYLEIGITTGVNDGDLIGLSLFIFILVVSLVQLLGGTSNKKTLKIPQTAPQKDSVKTLKIEKEESTTESVPIIVEDKATWSDRLQRGLTLSRKGVWGKLSKIVGSKGINDDAMDEIEEILYSADIGGEVVSELLDSINDSFKKGEIKDGEFIEFLKSFIRSKMQKIQGSVDQDLYRFNKDSPQKTKVIMVVGVNGAGKTTTIGKLATKLTNEGAKVVVGACDTFRAAAVDQLAVWCDRAGAKMVRAKEGSNPSGVGYDTLQTAINDQADYCILDTAGRLHTKTNLMEELTKSKNVLTKLDLNAPHQTLLVIDAITGQNAIKQAEEFNKALSLTGLILTKCDGSSKAGSAIGIVDKLQVPIIYIGVGEDVADLNVFDLDEYLNAMLGVNDTV